MVREPFAFTYRYRDFRGSQSDDGESSRSQLLAKGVFVFEGKLLATLGRAALHAVGFLERVTHGY